MQIRIIMAILFFIIITTAEICNAQLSCEEQLAITQKKLHILYDRSGKQATAEMMLYQDMAVILWERLERAEAEIIKLKRLAEEKKMQ